MIIEINERRFVKVNSLQLKDVMVAGKKFNILEISEREGEVSIIFVEDASKGTKDGDVRIQIRNNGAIDLMTFDTDPINEGWNTHQTFVGLFK